MKEFSAMVEMAESVVKRARENQFDQEVCSQLLNWFYTEGWDLNFSGDGDFYKKGDAYKPIEENLSQDQKGEYEALLARFWKILPDFYLAHKGGYEYVETPENFDPERPFEL